MIIDIHAHVYLDSRIRTYPHEGCTPFMNAEQQIKMMDEKGVDKSVILPLNNAEAPAEKQSLGEILAICEKYPGRFIPFCNFDPRIAKRPEDIEVENYEFFLNQYKEAGCKGVGEFSARMYFDAPIMLKFFKACENVGFPVIFHTITEDVDSYGVLDEIGLPHLAKVLDYCPNLKMLGHSPGFWSEISGELTHEDKIGYAQTPVKPGGNLQKLLRRYPNLCCDMSAGSGLISLKRDPEHAWKFISEFQDKIYLGLDYCSPNNDMQHIEWLTQARNDGDISEDAYQKIIWKNANRLLGLGL